MRPRALLPKTGETNFSLDKTEERVTITDGVITIENIAYTKEGAELVVATTIQDKAGLEARKAQIIKQRQVYADRFTADEAKIDEMLGKIKE